MPAEPDTRPLVLYVDDELANRVVFEQSLRTEFSIRSVADGNEALEVMAAHDVAVMVTDIRMPQMGGEELLRIVKERHPNTIRMVITAYADIEPILRAINDGLVARYLIKPWARAELVQVLRWATEAWMFSRDSAELHRRLLETERLATLGSIAAMLVHDLRQPLMSMVANIDALREVADAAPILAAAVSAMNLPEAQRNRLVDVVSDVGALTTDLRTAADHLNAMIGNLRELSRPNRQGAVAIASDPLVILRHAMTVCHELVLKVSASIDYHGPNALPPVRISPTELTQVLINLIANSSQAVAARGGPDGNIDISARRDDTMLELEIRDNGVGMSPEVLARIGTPFFTTRATGTGLGIAQCQRLISIAGGRLRIDSVSGVGTTVMITLPIVA